MVSSLNKIISKRYFLCYTLLFIIMVPLVFATFWINEFTFIWKDDGWPQHYQALLYYASYLRNIVRNFIKNGSFYLPTYSFGLGYGGDLLGILHYYVIGDPIAALSIFVPSKWMQWFYDGSIILRLYLSGITFSMYCIYRRETMEDTQVSNVAVLIGALVYVFCGYALCEGIRHPYFTNPMIYFPLVLLGVEKVLDGRKPLTLVIGVFLSAISNFYFFYMIVLLTVLYVLWRILTIYGKRALPAGIAPAARITLWSAAGTGMATVILLPIILFFLGDVRSELPVKDAFFYSLTEYEELLKNFMTVYAGKEISRLGYGAIVLVCLAALFIQRDHKDLKVAVIVTTVMQLLPWVGIVMNGFSYASNRWIWGFSMLAAFVVTVMWDGLFTMSGRSLGKIALVVGGYFALCLLIPKSRGMEVYVSVAFAFAVIGILLYQQLDEKSGRFAEGILTLCVFMNFFCTADFIYSQKNEAYAMTFVERCDVENKLAETELYALESVGIKEEKLGRFAGDLTRNATLNFGGNSTQYYWSLSNGNISEFMTETGLCYELFQDYSGLDNRAILSTLANVKYHVQKGRSQSGDVPFGYEGNNIFTDESYSVWETDYDLPFGYTYDGYLSEDTYDNMTMLQKQEAMLQAVVVAPEEAEGNESEVYFTGESIPYKMSISSGIELKDGCFHVTGYSTSVTLTFDGLEESETYLAISGLKYKGISPRNLHTEEQWEEFSHYDQRIIQYNDSHWEPPTSVTLSVSAENEKSQRYSKNVRVITPEYEWYSGQENYMVNLNYDPMKKTAITIWFPTTGDYYFDSIEVLCQPMELYVEQVSALQQNALENVDFHDEVVFNATNRVSGQITLDKAKYLLLTIPYSDGWSAYVDGEPHPLYRANTMFMTLYLQPGTHDIELRYETPGLKAGMVISAVCVLVVLTAMVYWKKKT